MSDGNKEGRRLANPNVLGASVQNVSLKRTHCYSDSEWTNLLSPKSSPDSAEPTTILMDQAVRQASNTIRPKCQLLSRRQHRSKLFLGVWISLPHCQ